MYDPEFLASVTLENGISLNELMDELRIRFIRESTQRNARNVEKAISNPRKAVLGNNPLYGFPQKVSLGLANGLRRHFQGMARFRMRPSVIWTGRNTQMYCRCCGLRNPSLYVVIIALALAVSLWS